MKRFSFIMLWALTALLAGAYEAGVTPLLHAPATHAKVNAPAADNNEPAWGDWEELGTATVTYCGAPYKGTNASLPLFRRTSASDAGREQFRVDNYLLTNVESQQARPLVIDVIDGNVFVYPQELPALNIKDENGNPFEGTLSVVDYATATGDETFRILHQYTPATHDFQIWMVYYITENGRAINGDSYVETIKFDSQTSLTVPSFMTVGGNTGMGFFPCETSPDIFWIEYAIVKDSGAGADGTPLADRVAAREEGLPIMMQMAGQIMVAPAEGPGRYSIGIAAYDMEEKVVAKASAKIYWMPEESWAWTKLGKATVTENFMPDAYGIEPPVYEVEIEESSTTKGLYRLVNLYGADTPFGPMTQERTIDFTHYTYIHCENPQQCYVEETPVGVIFDPSGEPFIASWARNYNLEMGYDMETIHSMMPELFGTLSDGTIDFPTGTLCTTSTLLLDNGYGWLSTGSMGSFKIVLPKETGIGDISTDTPAEESPRYYNLQGIRVANPTPGNVYIRHIGTKAEKIVF